MRTICWNNAALAQTEFPTVGVDVKGLLPSLSVIPNLMAPVGPFWEPLQVAAVTSPCPDLIF